MKRELQVAFSPQAQPIWFRIVKWIVLINVIRRHRRASWFRPVMVGLACAALGLHMFYRHKTAGWTRAWGGWNDSTFIQPASD